jgi:hypothetical protein
MEGGLRETAHPRDPWDYLRHALKGDRKEVRIACGSQVVAVALRLIGRHSHRDLLKTAHTVVDMRETLDHVQSQHDALVTYSSQMLSNPPSNAESYIQRHDRTHPCDLANTQMSGV